MFTSLNILSSLVLHSHREYLIPKQLSRVQTAASLNRDTDDDLLRIWPIILCTHVLWDGNLQNLIQVRWRVHKDFLKDEVHQVIHISCATFHKHKDWVYVLYFLCGSQNKDWKCCWNFLMTCYTFKEFIFSLRCICLFLLFLLCVKSVIKLKCKSKCNIYIT